MVSQNASPASELASKIAETESGLACKYLDFEFYVRLDELRVTLLPDFPIESAHTLSKYLQQKGWPYINANNIISKVTSVLAKQKTPVWAVTVLDLNQVKGEELQAILGKLLPLLVNYGLGK